MKRLGTLVMAILVITGCNAMRPNMEETELLWAETEKNIQKWAISTNAEASPAEKPRSILEPTVEIPQKTPTPTEEPTPQTLTATPSPKPPLPEQENIIQSKQATPPQTEQPAENRAMIDWPYPAITCPPEPPVPTLESPYITAPEPPIYTPEPEPTEPPQEQPTSSSVPDVPVDPTPEPTEQPSKQPADSTPEPPAEQPSSGYAECSCGARLTPDEVVPHMKAHALNGENHSYRAY